MGSHPREIFRILDPRSGLLLGVAATRNETDLQRICDKKLDICILEEEVAEDRLSSAGADQHRPSKNMTSLNTTLHEP